MYAGAFCQLTIGRIGWSVLCSLMRPLIVGFVGVRFLYFHLLSGLMSGTVYCFSDLSLECFRRVCIGGLETVVYEVLDFLFVLLYREYNYGVAFVCGGCHGIIVF